MTLRKRLVVPRRLERIACNCARDLMRRGEYAEAIRQLAYALQHRTMAKAIEAEAHEATIAKIQTAVRARLRARSAKR